MATSSVAVSCTPPYRRRRPERTLLYRNVEPRSRSAQIPTPLELIDRLAAMVPPPRVHRHRYVGVSQDVLRFLR